MKQVSVPVETLERWYDELLKIEIQFHRAKAQELGHANAGFAMLMGLQKEIRDLGMRGE